MGYLKKMCDLCEAVVQHYGEFLPGVYLVRATRDSDSIKRRQWGVVFQNTPFICWYKNPSSFNKHPGDWNVYFEEFLDGYNFDFEEIEKLLEIAHSCGMTKNDDYETWITDRIAEFLEGEEQQTLLNNFEKALWAEDSEENELLFNTKSFLEKSKAEYTYD